MARKRPDWPKTEYGTVNWDIVFENPISGIIPFVQRAATPLELKESTIEVVDLLFPRDRDRDEIKRFADELETLIPDSTPLETLPVLQEEVIGILRQVRDSRAAGARAYELKKIQEAEDLRSTGEVAPPAGEDDAPAREIAAPAEIDRREDPPEGAPAVSFLSIPLIYKKSLWAGFGAVAAAIGLLVLLFGDPVSGVASFKPKPSLKFFVAQVRQAAVDKVTKPHVYGGILLVSEASGTLTVTASEVPHTTCTSAVRVLVRTGTIIINGHYSKKLPLDEIERLCGRSDSTAAITWRPRTSSLQLGH